MTQRITDTNGWYEVKRNPLSRVGVFPYRGASVGLEGPEADKVVRVYRPEEELAHPECLESFRLLPWIDEHTMLGPGEDVTAAEVKGVQGVIGEDVFYDSGVLYGNIKVFSNSLARLIDAGKKELSCGYRCVYDWTPGTYNGQPYDCVQRQIRGNHVALVHEGRMGPSVAVQDHLTFSFDAQEAIHMAEEKDGATGGATGGAGSMTLEECAKMLGQIGPQVAKLTELMAAMGGGAKPAATTPPPADGSTPPPAHAAQAAATPDAVTAGAMDAALKPMREQLAGIVASVAAMDAAIKNATAAVVLDVASRDKLADRLANVVGSFDAKDKTTAQVAAYGCEKLGLKPPAGSELVALDAYLTAAEKAPAATVRTGAGMDAAPAGDNFVTRHLTAATK